MEVNSTSEDELRVVFRIDDSEFRRQLGELRREVEETERGDVGPARPRTPEPPIQVTISQAVDGSVSEEKMRELSDRVAKIESGAGLGVEQSQLTVANVERRLKESVDKFAMGAEMGLVAGTEDQYSAMFTDLFGMLEELGRREGRETRLYGWTNVSNISALRFIDRFPSEVLTKDLTGAHRGTAESYRDKASSALLKGIRNEAETHVFHTGVQKGLMELINVMKGGDIVSGMEITLPDGGRIDFGATATDPLGSRYVAEVKTGKAGRSTATQLAEYVTEMVYQEYMTEKEVTDRAAVDEKDMKDWLKEFIPQRKEALTAAGKEHEPWIKALTVAAGITGEYRAKLDLKLRKGVTKQLVEEGEIRRGEIVMPPKAREYIRNRMAELPREEQTSDALGSFWIEWLAGDSQSQIAKDLLNELKIPQEEFNAYFKHESDVFHKNVIRDSKRAGEFPEKQRIIDDIKKIVIEPLKTSYDPARWQERDAMRSAGFFVGGKERRRGRVAKSIGTTLKWGIEAFADQILSGDVSLEAIAGGVVGRPSLEPERIEEEVDVEEEEEEEPRAVGDAMSTIERAQRSAWETMTGRPDPRLTMERITRQMREEQTGMTIEEERRLIRERTERIERMRVGSARMQAGILPVQEEHRPMSVEDELQEMVEELRSPTEPVESMGGVLPVDIDLRRYKAKLTIKARKMGLTLEEFEEVSRDAESGELMKDITADYQGAITAMRIALTGGEDSRQRALGKDLRTGLKQVFGDRAGEIIEEIRKPGAIDAGHWTEDLKMIMNAAEAGEGVISRAVKQITPFTSVERGIKSMEEFKKYSMRLEPATDAFTWGNCA